MDIPEYSKEHLDLIQSDPQNNDVMIVPAKTSKSPGWTVGELPYTLVGKFRNDLRSISKEH